MQSDDQMARALASYERDSDTDDAPDPRRGAEEARERLFWEFEVCCREIAEKHGWGAVVKAVGRAMELQQELIET